MALDDTHSQLSLSPTLSAVFSLLDYSHWPVKHVEYIYTPP